MKEKIRKFWRKHYKPMLGILAIAVLAVGILFVFNLESKQNLVQTSSETKSNEITSEEEIKLTGVLESEETPEVEEAIEPVKDFSESIEENISVTDTPTMVEAINSETDKPSVTKKAEIKTEEEPTSVVKPTEKSATLVEQTVTATTETKYVPISEGWKAEASAKGDITSTQKADLDSMIQTWKSGDFTDAELKDKIISYLEEQKIDYMEVSVTSEGYALCEEVPEIDLRDGGNLYSYVGTYSTGKQNPNGTNKTVCYNWSAFVF